MDRGGEWDLTIQRFTDEQVNVLGHDDVAENLEVVPLAGEFQRVEKDVFGSRGSKVGSAAVTTEGDEMVIAFSLESFET